MENRNEGRLPYCAPGSLRRRNSGGKSVLIRAPGALSRNPFRGQTGLSLIELLVAAALSLSIAGVAIRAYLAGSALQNEVTAELRLHESARYALHVLGQRVRLAGFPGCLGETGETSPLDPAWQAPGAFSPVEGWNSERPHPDFGAGAEGDVIALRWSVRGCGANAPPELRPPRTTGGNPALRGSLFYTGRRGNQADNPPALFLRDLSNFAESGPARELVAGLESIRFGYQTGGGALLPAEQVGDWSDVRGVRVELQLRSLLVPGIERGFSQTLSLRNRPLAAADFPRIVWPSRDTPGNPDGEEP